MCLKAKRCDGKMQLSKLLKTKIKPILNIRIRALEKPVDGSMVFYAVTLVLYEPCRSIQSGGVQAVHTEENLCRSWARDYSNGCATEYIVTNVRQIAFVQTIILAESSYLPCLHRPIS